MKSFNDKTPPISQPRDGAEPAYTDENSEVERRIYGNYQNLDAKLRSTNDVEEMQKMMNDSEPPQADRPFEEDPYEKAGGDSGKTYGSWANGGQGHGIGTGSMHEENFQHMPSSMKEAAMSGGQKHFAAPDWAAADSHHDMGGVTSNKFVPPHKMPKEG